MAPSCNGVGLLAYAFLWLSLVVAILETVLTLLSKLHAYLHPPPVSDKPPERAAFDLDAWAKFVEALGKLLATLKDLPAWIAIFLAGLALLWTSATVAHLCT
jgi:hypothetical protein